MKHSLWIEVTLTDKYLKYFLKNGILNNLRLTSSEYFVLLLLIAIEKKVSFYELKKLIPIEPKQLHLIIKNLVEKDFIKREFYKNSSKIWVPDSSKDIILKAMDDNYKSLYQHFGDVKLQTLLLLNKEFNDLCRETLKRERIEYKNPLENQYYHKCKNCKENIQKIIG